MVSSSDGKEIPLACLNLYEVQDNDRPMYVVAGSWSKALEMWKGFMAAENGIPLKEMDEPKGIHLVCDNDDLLLP